MYAHTMSCAHACASEHMCAQACGTAWRSGIHSCVHHARLRVLPITCACKHVEARIAAYTHVCIMIACVCFRSHVPASMCNGMQSCVHVRFHVHMRVLPSACACTCNFMGACVCFRAHVRARRCQLRRATLHYWPAGAPPCIVQPLY